MKRTASSLPEIIVIVGLILIALVIMMFCFNSYNNRIDDWGKRHSETIITKNYKAFSITPFFAGKGTYVYQTMTHSGREIWFRFDLFGMAVREVMPDGKVKDLEN